MQLWFRRLARKSLSGQKINAPCCRARKLPVRLRLEAVEDRTLASAVYLEPPELTPSAPETGANSGQIVEIPSDELVPEIDKDVGAADPGEPIVDPVLVDAPGNDIPASEFGDNFSPFVRDPKSAPNPATPASARGSAARSCQHSRSSRGRPRRGRRRAARTGRRRHAFRQDAGWARDREG